MTLGLLDQRDRGIASSKRWQAPIHPFFSDEGERTRTQVNLLDAPVALIEDIGLDLYTVIERVGRVEVTHLDRSRIGERRSRTHAAPIPFAEIADAPPLAQTEGERA